MSVIRLSSPLPATMNNREYSSATPPPQAMAVRTDSRNSSGALAPTALPTRASAALAKPSRPRATSNRKFSRMAFAARTSSPWFAPCLVKNANAKIRHKVLIKIFWFSNNSEVKSCLSSMTALRQRPECRLSSPWMNSPASALPQNWEMTEARATPRTSRCRPKTNTKSSTIFRTPISRVT